MAEEEKCSEALDLLQPEILSKDRLIECLKKRQVGNKDLDHLSKEFLVELFHKNVVPQPQRKYRSNRRGQLMARNQLSIEQRKRKFSQISDGTDKSHKTGQSSTNARFLTSFNLPPAGDRLKPPPSAINFERKTIKLGGSNKAEASVTSSNNDKPFATGSKIKLSNTSTNSSVAEKDLSPKAGMIKQKKLCYSDTHKSAVVTGGNAHANKDINSSKSMAVNDGVPAKKVKLNRSVNDAMKKSIVSVAVPEAKMSTNENKAMSQTNKVASESPDGASDESRMTAKFKRVAIKWP